MSLTEQVLLCLHFIQYAKYEYDSQGVLNKSAVLRGEPGPRTLFEARKVGRVRQHIHKVRQCKLCCPLISVCLFSHFIC